MLRRPRILIVDLANFAYYPTLAVGYLVALLRRDGFEVGVLSPLSFGVPSQPRERVEGRWDHLERSVSFSTRPAVAHSAALLGAARRRWRARVERRVLARVERALAERPDALLVSTYTDSYSLCVAIGELASAAGIPVLLGGPAFNDPRIAGAWTALPGLSAVVGAEVEEYLTPLVHTLLSGGDLASFPGVFLPDGRSGPPPPPLRSLDALPHPDFSDFPWSAYPHRIVPVLTARGCGWGACRFCGDVVTANGRSYRTRSVDSVLDELRAQCAQYGTREFAFLDIKLNSNLEMWRALIQTLPARLPQSRWIATVHVADDDDNGLDGETLRLAAAAGLTRVTFGLESASQRLLDQMDKGTRVERNEAFVRAADEAGLSVRTTVIQGWPGEEADDLEATARLLERNTRHLDRVRLNRFNALPGTRFERDFERKPERFPGLSELAFEYRFARAGYRYAPSESPAYRRALARVLRAVHEINRRPLKTAAQAFDGIL